MTLNPEIKRLTEKWYQFALAGRKPDNDLHWYIEIDYAYGDRPTYQARFEGFSYQPEEEMPLRRRLIAAQEDLLQMIHEAIDGQKKWVGDVLGSPSSWDKELVEEAKKFNELFYDD